MARPTKLTAELEQRIVGAVRAGNHVHVAAQAAGIATSTLYRWRERGRREPAGIFHDLEAAVARAEAEAEVHAAAVVRKAMPEDWRAAAWYLERRQPERWRRREKLELEPSERPAEAAAPLDLTRLSDADLEALRQLHDRARR